MDREKLARRAHSVLDVELLTIGDAPITIGTLGMAFAIVVGTVLASRLVDRAVLRAFELRGLGHDGTARVVMKLLHYVLLITGLLAAIDVAGVDLRALFAAGAVFAVGIGFAMQNIVQNFVSGVILLIERSIKPGDVLEVQGQIVRVQQMGIRATIVRTRDEEEMIVPNSTLVQGTVKNFTMRDSLFRLRVSVGVSYASDMKGVRRILEEVGDGLSWRAPEQPRVFLAGFGNSSVDFELAVWTDDPWMSRIHMSEMREAIWFALLDAGVTIAFPQVDVHFDEPVAAGFAAMGKAA